MTSKDSQTRHFERRYKSAKAGLHLPSEEELLRGMGFFRGELKDDIREYAERLSRRVKKRKDLALAALAACLDELAVEQSEDGVQCVQAALQGADAIKGVPVEACRLRCQYYLACLGNPEAAAKIAAEAASLAQRDFNQDAADRRMLGRALAWAVLSRSLVHARNIHGIHSPGRSVFPMLRGYQEDFEAAILGAAEAQEPKRKEEPVAGDPTPILEDDATDAAATASSVIVIASVGNDTTSDGKRVAREFERFVQRRLPLQRAPDLAVVRTRLTTEFPWAMSVTDEILKGFVGREDVYLRPTILLGTPGCGKTRLARRLVEELGVPYELVPCGGLSDSALGGTARRWMSGEPSLAVMSVRRHECAGPAIILDEIEKVGTSRHNGNVHDVMVGLFERETSSRWFDPYVEAACDLSHLTWLMTANTVEPIPVVLRDRCRILRFPAPSLEHLPLLASRILKRLYLETGHDPRWATPLEEFEIKALASAWAGGSIRKLERIVEMLVETRERHRQQH